MGERPINPPEPLCPRCRKICWPDELTEENKCPHCGFDGSEDICVVCKRPIPPSSGNYGYSICEPCEQEGHRERWEAGDYDDEPRFEDYIEEERRIDEAYWGNQADSLDDVTKWECYAIEQGLTDEELQELLRNKPQEDAS
jgi:hypothetical protein